jgi:hypothetical protein
MLCCRDWSIWIIAILKLSSENISIHPHPSDPIHQDIKKYIHPSCMKEWPWAHGEQWCGRHWDPQTNQKQALGKCERGFLLMGYWRGNKVGCPQQIHLVWRQHFLFYTFIILREMQALPKYLVLATSCLLYNCAFLHLLLNQNVLNSFSKGY